MEAISAAAGTIAAIPQCIEAAKQLYDLRERYKEASMLITAIYTESMIIAAALTQVQSLVQRAAFQNKPELLDTLDLAMTGCWVVYQCLNEEVRDLAREVDVNDMRRRDRALFLLNEDYFKELLQQIRGQQSALGLLIQGLQMESISDVQQLVEENRVKLDQIAKRSRTLRQKHPNIKVPESVIDKDKDSIDFAQSLFGDVDFTFDDEIVNSEAYRRAMARACSIENGEEPTANLQVTDGGSVDLSTEHDGQHADQQMVNGAAADTKIEQDATEAPLASANETDAGNAKILDDLERSLLLFMPPAALSHGASIVDTQCESKSHSSHNISSRDTLESAEPTLMTSVVDEPGEQPEEIERPPPLPPRVAQASSTPDTSDSAPDLRKTSSWENIFAPLSTTSSLPLANPVLGEVAVKTNSTTSRTDSPPEEGDVRKLWTQIMVDEEKYIEAMKKFRTTFYNSIIKEWPVLEKHLEAIVIGERLMPLHQEYIVDTLKKELPQTPPANCDPRLFIKWVAKAYKLFKEYSQRFPHALYALRLTRHMDPKFNTHVDTLGLDRTWEEYLMFPIKQLDTYVTNLQNMEKITSLSIKDESRLTAALYVLEQLRTQCSVLTERSTSREEIQRLHRKIYTADADIVNMLKLCESERRIIHQAPLAIKFNGHGTWQSVHAILLDNHFLWGKVKTPKPSKHQGRKEDNLWVIEQPIHVSRIAVRLPAEAAQLQKTSFYDELPRGVSLYEIFVDVKRDKPKTKTHILGAFSIEERNIWYEKLSAVVETNAEVPPV